MTSDTTSKMIFEKIIEALETGVCPYCHGPVKASDDGYLCELNCSRCEWAAGFPSELLHET